jgi:hypothetical protein
MGSSNQIGIAMYSFDENGDALWVVGNVPISPSDIKALFHEIHAN